MDDSFHFALLRVSICQILKSSGFDKCKPSTLNIITDLYIKYFDKLVKECMKCSQLRNRSNVVELQDVTQGLIMTGSIIPRNFIKLNDQEGHNYNTKSLQSFVNWIKYSNLFLVSRKLNELPTSLLSNLIEKRRLDLNDGETDQEKKKRKYKEKQEFYNQLKLNDGNTILPGNANTIENDDFDENIITDSDKLKWLNYLIEKDLKLGHNLKFWNTALQEEFQKFENNLKFHPNNKNKLDQDQYTSNKHDYLVLNIDSDDDGDEDTQIVKPSEKLINILPYNLKYDPNLLHDIDYEDFEHINQESSNDIDSDEIAVKEIEVSENVESIDESHDNKVTEELIEPKDGELLDQDVTVFDDKGNAESHLENEVKETIDVTSP